MPRINVSFKNNERDKKLKDVVDLAHDKSAFIKDCIEFYLAHKDVTFNNSTKDKDKNGIDDVDWEF